jgi:hypothetical protein
MQTSYYITKTGLNYAIASNIQDSFSCFLLLIIKKHLENPIKFNEVIDFYKNDRVMAFKQICEMIKLDLIDVYEKNYTTKTIDQSNKEILIDSLYTKNDYVLSDSNGLPISYYGFNQQQSINISAIAYDLIRASRRARYDNQNHDSHMPLCIKTTLYDIDINIIHIFLGTFSCLLTTRFNNLDDQSGFIELISFLYNRYSYG